MARFLAGDTPAKVRGLLIAATIAWWPPLVWCIPLVWWAPLVLGQASGTSPLRVPDKENQAKAGRRTLAELVPPPGRPEISWNAPDPPAINDADIVPLGIRKLVGRHLILYTDLPPMPGVDELPRVFDAAVPEWCAYFEIPQTVASGWRSVAYLMQDKGRFQRAGRLPGDLPPFLNGYQRGAELWLYEQPSDYYRRHLLLHEGTHGFMRASLGGAGSPWYMEGMAELLATHRWWNNGQLTLNWFPQRKDEVEEWGRIKIVRDAYRQGAAKPLSEVLRYDSQAHLRVEPYGWCWASAAFFDGHPAYRQRFRELRKFARDTEPSFSERFVGWLGDDLAHVQREWQLYVARLDYGYDVAREAIERRPTAPLPPDGAEIQVAVDRGWQSSGIRLETGQRYEIVARGRYQVGNQPKSWWCEPNGITIRYAGGRPLGLLLGAIVDEQDTSDRSNGFLTAAALGTGLTTTLRRSGTLYLRVNEFPNELADNQGQVTVRIERAGPK